MRPVSRRASTRVSAGSASTHREVGARLAGAAAADGPPLRAHGGRAPAARRSSPSASAAGPRSGRGTRARPRAALIIAESRRCASASRATSISPEVSRSSRWTIPGRSASPPPSRSPSTSTSVGPRCPGAGWTTRPGRLVDHREPLVAVDDPRLVAHGSVGLAAAPAPATASAITTTPSGDRDVGEVERRPQRRVEEVGDRAVAQPVDEVAERAAGQQPDPEPQPGRVGVEGEPADDQRQRDDRDREHQARRCPRRAGRRRCRCW